MVGSYITLRGYVSGRKEAKITDTNFATMANGTYVTGMIRCNQPMQPGDSGGGAIGGYADGNRTALIVGINKATDSNSCALIKGAVICDAYS